MALLALASAAAIYVTRQSLDIARQLGERAMESTALALSASAESALRAGSSGSELRNILSDRVVAYALIFGSDGVVRFHVNPELVGTRLPETGPGAWVPGDHPLGRRITLGLGTPAYEYNYPLRGPDGTPETLRLVLNLGAVDQLHGQSHRLWAVVGGVLALLAVAGVALDRLTRRLLALRETLDRRERLSWIGQMTATLAHEIRNALWGIKGYAQWLDEKLAGESSGKSDVTAILQGAGRIENLVDDLLLYAREETYQLEPVLLAPLVGEVCSQAALGWRGEVRMALDGTLSVQADREKLRQVLVNGVRNATQAMGSEGTLTIDAGGGGGFVWLRLEDTGGGISPQTLDRLFTPFHTTKTDGTGLGLAYSRKVVEGMHGTIQLENGARGAVLTLRLPAAKEG